MERLFYINYIGITSEHFTRPFAIKLTFQSMLKGKIIRFLLIDNIVIDLMNHIRMSWTNNDHFHIYVLELIDY